MIRRTTLFLPIPVLAFAALAFVSTGCKQPEAASPAPAPAVTVAPVEQREIVEWSEFTGRTEPLASVEIRPRVSGYIEEVRFDSGQMVKKGEVLFVIDPRWHKAEFDQTQAAVVRAQVLADNAKREADRTTQLLAGNAISKEDGDARLARYEEAKAALQVAEAVRDTAKLDLDYTQVRAPIDGRVSRAFLTEGNYVSGLAGAATLLTTVVSVSPVYVYADMDEDALLKFNAQAKARSLETDDQGRVPVELQLADEPDYPHRGYIESFDNRVNPDTGSILLRAVFPNEDGRIVPGLFARIRVPLTAKHPVLLVDEEAIGTDQAEKYVLTLTSTNTVAYQAVKLGPAVNGKRVVRDGLAPGKKIVVNGIQRVRSGMVVTPEVAAVGLTPKGLETAQR